MNTASSAQIEAALRSRLEQRNRIQLWDSHERLAGAAHRRRSPQTSSEQPR